MQIAKLDRYLSTISAFASKVRAGILFGFAAGCGAWLCRALRLKRGQGFALGPGSASHLKGKARTTGQARYDKGLGRGGATPHIRRQSRSALNF